MKNKYAQRCFICGHMAKSGAGHFERYPGGWRVRHDGCKTSVTPDSIINQIEPFKETTPRKKTQEERVIDRMREVGYVDNFWCIKNYILRLGAVIQSLEREGWSFQTYWGQGPEKRNYHYTPVTVPAAFAKDFLHIQSPLF